MGEGITLPLARGEPISHCKINVWYGFLWKTVCTMPLEALSLKKYIYQYLTHDGSFLISKITIDWLTKDLLSQLDLGF